MMIPEKALAGISYMTVAELLQLPSVRIKYIDIDNMKHFLALQLGELWRNKYGELTEVVK